MKLGALKIAAVAWIVARNLVPVAGMIFLGWKAHQLVLLYYLDTMVGIASLITQLFIHSKDVPRDYRYKAKEIGGIAIAVALLTGIYALVMGFPVIVSLGMSDEGLDTIFGDEEFLMGLGIQLVVAGVAFLAMGAELRRSSDPDKIVKTQFAFVTLRWVVVFAMSVTLPFAVLMVIAYVGASIYFEVRPPPPAFE